MSAGFRKTRRHTKVVCCVLNLCTRFFHQKVRGDQPVHAVSARFRKTRRYTKVVCCVLNLCTRFIHQKVRGDQPVHAVSARFHKAPDSARRGAIQKSLVACLTAPSCYGHTSALAHLPATIFCGNCLERVPGNQIIFCLGGKKGCANGVQAGRGDVPSWRSGPKPPPRVAMATRPH